MNNRIFNNRTKYTEKMKPMNIKAILGLALVAGSFASCSVDQQELPSEELYARNFYKTFGVNFSSEGFNVV